MKNPCWGCEARHENCHASCVGHHEYKEWLNEAKEKEKKDTAMRGFDAESYYRSQCSVGHLGKRNDGLYGFVRKRRNK